MIFSNATKTQRDTKSMHTVKEREELLAKEIVDCCNKVHKQLGPGLLEKVYGVCLCHELSKGLCVFVEKN